MTTTTEAPPADASGDLPEHIRSVERPPAGRPLFPDVLRSEWIKFRSVRSTYWTLLVTVAGMIGLGALFTAAFVAHYHHMGLQDQIEASRITPVARSDGGFFLMQLAVGVLGVIVMTSEYATGSIRATFSAVPQRRMVLAAKAVVYAATVLVIGVGSAFAAFFVGQAILSQIDQGVSISSPGALRGVIGTGLYLTVIGLLSLGLGTMIRRTAGAIAALVALVLILPGVVAALPSSWQNAITPYLPSVAGQAIIGRGPVSSDHMLSAWTGFGIFCAYAAASLIVGAFLLNRRDA